MQNIPFKNPKPDPFSYHIDIDSVWRFIVPHTKGIVKRERERR